MIRRPTLFLAGLLCAGLALSACSEGGSGSASETGGSVTSDLLNSRETMAEDPRQRMSTGGAVGAGVMEWMNEQLPEERVDLDTLGFDFGDPDAPVRILEFSDFGCGYCRQFHLETFPALHDRYIETGDVYWKYVPILLGIFPNSVEAALVGECVGEQGRFYEVTNELFERQSDWKRASDPMPVFWEIAEAAGADVEQVRQCVEAETPGPRIAAGSAFANNNGVRGTPNFFILGYTAIPGAVPLDLFSEIIDSVKVDVQRRSEAAGSTPNVQGPQG